MVQLGLDAVLSGTPATISKTKVRHLLAGKGHRSKAVKAPMTCIEYAYMRASDCLACA